jgi:hypothetical protein
MQKVIPLFFIFLLYGSNIQVRGQESLEFSKADVFAKNNWDSRQVSVLGIKLGMSRSEAVSVAQNSGFESPQCGIHKPGQTVTEDLCSIFKNGHATFVDLIFRDDHVTEIRMQLFVTDAGGPLWIAKSMVGSTRQLATEYSDALRTRLLGREEEHCVQNPPFPPPRVQAFSHNYEYKRRGFAFGIVEVDSGEHANPRYKIVEVYLYLSEPKASRE